VLRLTREAPFYMS